MVRLADLQPGESGRIVRVDMPDQGCRRRFGELGLAEGMTVTMHGTGDTLMLGLCGGRMGVASRCACGIWVLRASA
jgi:Fe2+ transport system protein FeoA